MKKYFNVMFCFIVFMFVVFMGFIAFSGEQNNQSGRCNVTYVSLNAYDEDGEDFYIISENKTMTEAIHCWQMYAAAHCKRFDKKYNTSDFPKIEIVYKSTKPNEFETGYVFSATISCKE